MPGVLSVSPDGQWSLYDQEDVSGSDLVLVENFREEKRYCATMYIRVHFFYEDCDQ